MLDIPIIFPWHARVYPNDGGWFSHETSPQWPWPLALLQVLARLVRWWEGFLGMPVRRVEMWFGRAQGPCVWQNGMSQHKMIKTSELTKNKGKGMVIRPCLLEVSTRWSPHWCSSHRQPISWSLGTAWARTPWTGGDARGTTGVI